MILGPQECRFWRRFLSKIAHFQELFFGPRSLPRFDVTLYLVTNYVIFDGAKNPVQYRAKIEPSGQTAVDFWHDQASGRRIPGANSIQDGGSDLS